MSDTLATLPALAASINREHSAAVDSARSAVEHARRCGELLAEAKRAVGHGGFLKWLAANCQVKERQARNYMRMADNWPAIEAKTAPGADLTIKGALELLTEPKPEQVELPSVVGDIREIPDLNDVLKYYPEFTGVHPACLAFPMATLDEFRGIALSIQGYGLEDAIVTTADGQLLDGKIRLLACFVVGQDIRVRKVGPRWENPWEYVWAANGLRQDLNPTQKHLLRRHCESKGRAGQ